MGIWKLSFDILLVDAQLEVCHNLFLDFDESFLLLLIPGVFVLGIEVHQVPFAPTVSRKSKTEVMGWSKPDIGWL